MKAAGGILTGPAARWDAAAGGAGQPGIVVELGPRTGGRHQGTGAVGHREVLHHPLHIAVRAVADGEVAGHRDADQAPGIVGDQWRVLEPVDTSAARRPQPGGTAVVDMRHLGAGGAVEDLEPGGGRRR